jgi:hypothetical protein
MRTSRPAGIASAVAVAALVFIVGIAGARQPDSPASNRPHTPPGNPSVGDGPQGGPPTGHGRRETTRPIDLLDGADPALACAAAKQQAAGRYCFAALNAWARFELSGSAATRDAAIARAERALDAAWDRAEARGDAAGIECGGAFLAASTAGAFIGSAAGAMVEAVEAGLDPDDRTDALCASKVLRAAALECKALLFTESVYQKTRGRPGAADARESALARIRRTFERAFARVTKASCPTEATADDVADRVDGIARRVVRDVLSSPEAGDGAYVGITPGPVDYQGRTFTPVCMDGSPYRFYARRGTVNKLVMYYQGGGACWEQLTCLVPACDTNVVDAEDNPSGFSSGFADLDNPANPFRDWNAVFVSYCSCDIHFGDAAQDYTNFDPANPLHVEHRGYHNSKVAEKWAREHFLAPEAVFVTGSSAGAYGAWFNAGLLHAVWPSARFDVLADAGNGVVTQDFLEQYFPNWNFEANLPPEIPELRQVLDNGEGIVGYTKVITRTFPDTDWAHYTTAFDGGTGGQTGFYNIMLNGNDPVAALTWWEGSCAFRDAMQAQAVETAAAVDAQDGNYRYYIGSGSRHTMWGANKVYTSTLGGVPTIVDWISAMLASGPGAPDPGWTNVEANPYNVLLPGDVRPNPLQPPFVQSGGDVVVDCSAP